jgi:hypothetical protein
MDEMPPEPPEGVADIRFESGKIMEKVPPGHQLTVIPIKLRDIAYPITVRWNVHAENALIYNLVLAGHGRSGEAEGGHVGLSDSGSIVLEKKGHGNDNGNGNGNGNGDGGGGVIILQAEAPDPCDPPQAKTRIKADAEAVEENLPSVYALRQNFPNPFNPTTEIYYDLPESGPVSIVLYNILGQSVLTLVDEVQSAGYKSFNLNMSLFPSGVYYYRMQAGGFNDLKKMVLIK